MRRLPLTALLACALAAAVAAAQSTPPAGAGLQGVVRGAGVVVPGAEVSARQAGGKVERTTTDGSGVYRFPALAAGMWTVTAAMTGFATATQTATIAAGAGAAASPARLDFTLTLKPYTGPPATNGPPLGFRGVALAATGAAKAGTAAPAAGTAAEESAGFGNGPNDKNRTAAAALAINGSQDNAAASAFALPPAFGNHRPGLRSLFNGGFGMVLDNSALDARSFSLTGQPVAKPAYTNLTGLFQIGGPMLIPKLFNGNDAPFFSVMYQKNVARDVATTPALVPTPAERSGDLSAVSQPIVNPATGQAFSGNQVPVSAPAAALLALYPNPNFSGGQAFNYEAPLVTARHADNLQVRVNKFFGRANSLAGTFNLQSVRSDTPNVFGFTDRGGNLGLNAGLQWRHSFTQYLYGTFAVNYSRTRTQLTPFFANVTNVSGNAGIAGNDQTPANWGPPALQFSNGLAGLSDGQATRNRNQTAAFSFTGYWNHYDHNLSFGFDARRLEFNYREQANARGSFTFNGAATGNALADFLLGIPDAESLAFGNADKYFRQGTYDAFVTDDWRVSDSLSLDLGARWEYAAPITERYNRLVNLDITPGFAAAAPVLASAPTGALTGATYPASLLRPDRRAIEPRLGLAWTPLAASSLVIRAGYGVYYDTSVYPSIALRMAQQAPLSTSLNLANSAGQPLTLATGFLATPAGAAADTFAVDPNFRPGYAQTWDASLQQDLPGGMLLTLTYLGTKGTHNQQEYLPNTYAPGGKNPCPSCPAGFLYLASNGNSTYESGQVALERRFHSGLAWNLTYTYAHAIDDAILGGQGAGQGQSGAMIAQNWLDLSGERGNSSFDQRHKLTLTAQYSTGVGLVGGALLEGWMGALYRGWTVTSDLTLASGLPLTPATALLAPGTSYSTVRPDLTGQSVTAAPAGRFLNPAAYTLPAAGTWGDAGRNSIPGPGIFGLNAALQRSFPVSSRFTADLRVDATNVLNHVTYPSWNTLVGSPQFGLPLAANGMRSLQTTLRIIF